MKHRKVIFICYLLAAVCYLSIAATNFFGNLTAEGFLHLSLGAVNIVLFIEYAREHKKRKAKNNIAKENSEVDR